MSITFRALLFVCTVSFLSACSQSVSPTSPSSSNPGSLNLTAGDLAGAWTLASLQPTGGDSQSKPANATYSVTFADSRVSARADCNVCGGNATIAGNTLTLGPALACTRAACPTMEFESVFESILSGESTAQIDGATLTLTSARGRLTLVR